VTARQIVATGGGIGEPVRDYLPGLAERRPARALWVDSASAEDPWAPLRIHDLFAGLAEVRRLESSRGLPPTSASSRWFECGVTDSFGPQLSAIHDRLGFLPGSCCPHYDDEELRRRVYRDLVDRCELPPGLAADFETALHFVGTRAACGRHVAAGQARVPGRAR